MREKRLDLGVLVSALLISGLLFGAGFLLGYTLNKERMISLEKDIRGITKDVENFQLQFLFFDVLGENSTCPLLLNTLSRINKESYKIGSKLTRYGSETEIKDYNDYIALKREYSRLLISYWLLANKLKDVCNLNASTVIYFFSDKCSRCSDQGFVLTYLKNKLKERILIFALDGEFDEPSIQVLKNYYNIKEYPALVIDGEVYLGFLPQEKIEKIVCEHTVC